ncbi:hypothetical protein C8R47DRAFT_1228551 [Mycena vitilis]|nr:hypothetical protein C8R47DRAFT_1228551 [Mycena vitilis]
MDIGGHWRITGNAVNSTGENTSVFPSPSKSSPPAHSTQCDGAHRPFLALSETQTQVLDDHVLLLGVQLRSTWERQQQRSQETRLQIAVSVFLETTLAEPSQQALMDAAGA